MLIVAKMFKKKCKKKDSGKRDFENAYSTQKAFFNPHENHVNICSKVICLYDYHGFGSSSSRHELHSGQTVNPGRKFTQNHQKLLVLHGFFMVSQASPAATPRCFARDPSGRPTVALMPSLATTRSSRSTPSRGWPAMKATGLFGD